MKIELILALVGMVIVLALAFRGIWGVNDTKPRDDSANYEGGHPGGDSGAGGSD